MILVKNNNVPLWAKQTGADKIDVYKTKVAHVIVSDLGCVRNIEPVFQNRL